MTDVIENLLQADVDILWDIYVEIAHDYLAHPSAANRELLKTSYLKWRGEFLK